MYNKCTVFTTDLCHNDITIQASVHILGVALPTNLLNKTLNIVIQVICCCMKVSHFLHVGSDLQNCHNAKLLLFSVVQQWLYNRVVIFAYGNSVGICNSIQCHNIFIWTFW